MGCFDFTYADNGENIRGRRGYIYLSPEIATKANLPNPLPFAYTDMYGRFNIRISQQGVTRGIHTDIFALYTVLIHSDEGKLDKDDNKFINWLHNNKFKQVDQEYETLNDALRGTGIDYFFSHLKCQHDAYKITVPKLGNQREKELETHEFFQAKTPLLISRKKLPVDIDTSLKTMAQTWGYVSAGDPKQGFSPTYNRYCKYIYK